MPNTTLPSLPFLRASHQLAVGAVAFLVTVAPSVYAEIWDGPDTGGLWNNPANWDTNITFPDAVGAVAIFNNPASNRTVLLGEDITIGSLTFNNSSGFTNTISGNNEAFVLTFDATDAGPATIDVAGFNTLSGATNPNAIRGGVVLNDNLVINVAPTASTVGALTFLGTGTPGSSLSGPGGITKTGTGGLTFADTAKTFTGALVVNAGKLRLNATGRASGTSSVMVAAGGQLNLDAGTAAGTNNFTFGPAGNTTVITLNGNGVTEGPFAAFPGAIRKENTRNAQLDNPIVLQTSAAINVRAGDLRLSNTVSGPGMLTMGALPGDAALQPTLTLAADNGYSGGTTASSGTIIVASASGDLGTGNVTVDGKTTLVQGATTFTANGRLTIQTGVSNAINDLAVLTLTGSDLAGAGNDVGGFVTLETAVNETVGGLILGGAPQDAGTYGSTTSLATFRDDEYFSGPGMVTVIPEPGAAVMLIAGVGALIGLQRLRRQN